MDQEISLLRQEITRLERLNRLLLDRIITLESLMSHPENSGGDNEHPLSPRNIMRWDNEQSLSHPLSLQGDNKDSLFHPENLGGDNTRSLSQQQNVQGDKAALMSQPQGLQGDINAPVYPADPKMVDPEVLLVKSIRRSLGEGDMKGAPHKMIGNAAKALLHISRGGALDYHFVSSHYGYTPRSATKFIIALQRRGLVERKDGSRQLFLTEKGRKHLPA